MLVDTRLGTVWLSNNNHHDCICTKFLVLSKVVVYRPQTTGWCKGHIYFHFQTILLSYLCISEIESMSFSWVSFHSTPILSPPSLVHTSCLCSVFVAQAGAPPLGGSFRKGPCWADETRPKLGPSPRWDSIRGSLLLGTHMHTYWNSISPSVFPLSIFLYLSFSLFVSLAPY